MIPHTLSPASATVLVVASGKGGTGTSLVSALLALTVAGEGRRVLLVDGTEQFGGLHHMLGVAPRHPLSALRDGQVDVDALFTPVADTLALFPGGGGVSRLVLVATDDQIALAATHAMLKAVTTRLGPVAADVVVNRMGGEGAAEIFAPLADAAQRFLDRRLELAGALPHDPCLQGGLGAGMALQDAAAGSPCALAARLIGLRYVNGPESHGASAGGRLLAWHA